MRNLRLGIAWLAATLPLAAQQLSIDLDPAKSSVKWILAGNVHTVHGTFAMKRGHVALDTVSRAISGELVADATSGDSGSGARDKRMHKEILESQRYPEIKLLPSRLEGQISAGGGSALRVTGTFVIHGAPHEVTIPMEVAIEGGNVTGTAKFSVPYVDWGLKDPSNFLFKVDKSVEVEIVAVGKVTSK